MKILVWTWTEPDKASGSPDILVSLLNNNEPVKVHYVCEDRTPESNRKRIQFSFSVKRIKWPSRLFSYINFYTDLLLYTPYLVIHGVIQSVLCKPDLLLTIYYKPAWILSSHWIGRLVGKPVLYYVHDPFLEKYKKAPRIQKWIIAKIECITLRKNNVLVLYETLSKRYNEKYHINSSVLPHISDSSIPIKTDRQLPSPITIGFSGSIYANNIDQLKALIRIVDENENYRIKLWTNATGELIGVDKMKNPDRISLTFESDKQRLLRSLSSCDILYLPLAFTDSPSLPIETLQYVLPTKAVDYLQTGCHILVHCPDFFEMSNFFKKYGSAYILNDADPGQLKSFFEDFVNGNLPPIGMSTIQETLIYFDKQKNLKKFRELIENYGAEA